MKIMVCYDGSNVAKAALKIAKKHANAFNAQVSVVTSHESVSESKVKETERAEQDLENVKKSFEEDKIPCDTHLLIRGIGTGEDLVQFADENKIDQIIIGTRRRSKVGKLLFGSVAQYVIINASCPVLSVK